jgi:hypothetical protein
MTNRIKAALLNYYTFKRSAILVCTELYDGCYIADVVVLAKNNEVIEIEIKISKADIKHELSKGQNKTNWKILSDGSSERLPDIHINKHDILNVKSETPNKYYFCVPKELVEFTIEFANKLNPKYGVISFDDNRYILESLSIVKKAYSLHKNDISDKYKLRMLDRLSNDLCSKYRLLYYKLKVKKNKLPITTL